MAVVMRRAHASDRAGVLKVCANTWHGWDYVPRYFNVWLKEKGFYVMLDRGKVIGLAKYTELSPGELWLEGLRVDSARRSHGLGWKLSRFLMQRGLDEKPKSVRLATGRRNQHSRHIITRMGLRLKLALWGRHGPVPKRQGRPRVFVPTAQAAYDYIRTTEEYRTSKGLLQHTWQFHTITPELLARLGRKGCLFGYAPQMRRESADDADCADRKAGQSMKSAKSADRIRDGNLQGLLILQPGRYGRDRVDISFIEGVRKALPEFQRQIRRYARKYRATSIGGMATSRSMLRHFGGLRMRPMRPGMKRPWVMVYEYPLRKVLRPKFKGLSKSQVPSPKLQANPES